MSLPPASLRAGDIVTHDNWPGKFIVSVLPAVDQWDPLHPGVLVKQVFDDGMHEEHAWYAYYSFLHRAYPRRVSLPSGV